MIRTLRLVLPLSLLLLVCLPRQAQSGAVGDAIGSAASAVGTFVKDNAGLIGTIAVTAVAVGLIATGVGAPLGVAIGLGVVAGAGAGLIYYGTTQGGKGGDTPTTTTTGPGTTGTGTTGTGDTGPVVTPPGTTGTGDTGPVQNPGGGSGDGAKANGSADGGKGDPQGQTMGNRWDNNVKGPNTPFFGGTPDVGRKEEFVTGANPGAKGLNIPGFYAGKVDPKGTPGEKGLSYGSAGGSGGEPGSARGSSGGFGGGGGGGSPSLGSLLGSMDKPAGFEALEKKAAEELAKENGELAPQSDPSPTDAQAPRPDAMNYDKAVPMMGDGKAPGEQEARRVAELLASAKSKLNARDYKGAIDDLTEALKIAPKNASLWLHRSMAYNLAGNYEAAEKDALEAIKLDPENSRAWENLAWAQLKQGKYLEAMESATRALKLDPKNSFAYAIRAFAREKLGNSKGALDDIKRAASLDKRFLPFYQRAMRGQPIYDPNFDYSPFFLQKGKPLEEAGGPMWPVYLGMTLLLLCAASFGGMGLYYQHLKQKGKVSDFKQFMEETFKTA